MNFANGMLNLTNWLGNVIMPTLGAVPVSSVTISCVISRRQFAASSGLPAF